MADQGRGARKALLGLVYGFVPSTVISTVVNLRIPDIIARHGEDAALTAEEIAAKLPSAAPNVGYLARVLRFLVFYKVFRAEYGDGASPVRYGLTPMSQLLVSTSPQSLYPIVRMHMDSTLFNPFLFFDDAILDSRKEPFGLANGPENIWTACQEDMYFGKIFNDAMSCYTTFTLDPLLEEYQGFKEVAVVADVGGGSGKALERIIHYNPHLKGINFDMSTVTSTAPEIPGVSHVGGDMFTNIPEADAIFMKWILHDWKDEQCLQILRNCWKALPEKGGRLVLVESVLPSPDEDKNPEATFEALRRDMVMLAHTSGMERTKSEWRSLLSAAAFCDINFIPFPGGQFIIEAFKSAVCFHLPSNLKVQADVVCKCAS